MGGPPHQRAVADPRGSARDEGSLILPRRLLSRVRRQLHRGAGLVLIFDYDGTLTPIVPNLHAANLAASTRRILSQLAKCPGVKLAVLSGRSLQDIRTRVGLGNIVYGGCHGLEIEGAGLRFRHPNARAIAAQVRSAVRVLLPQLRRFPGAFLETKGIAASVHYRRLARGRRGDLRKLVARVERQVPGLRVLPAKNVFEFFPRVRWGKGQAVLWIARRLAGPLGRRRALILYAGDDVTDAAAFAALEGRGVTVRVGAASGLADCAVKNVRGIHALLRWIARQSEGAPSPRLRAGGPAPSEASPRNRLRGPSPRSTHS